MEDYKQRLVEEYQYVMNKAVRLGNIIAKASKGTLDFELSCPLELLQRQLGFMHGYIGTLEERAEIEGVTLSFDMKAGE